MYEALSLFGVYDFERERNVFLTGVAVVLLLLGLLAYMFSGSKPREGE
jgi:hypothetical protein